MTTISRSIFDYEPRTDPLVTFNSLDARAIKKLIGHSVAYHKLVSHTTQKLIPASAITADVTSKKQ